jgi:hypothetical protein
MFAFMCLLSFDRHPGESRDPVLALDAEKLDSGFRRNDEL